MCRTPALGGVLELCPRCDHHQPVCRSCGDRHCPECQALAGERWVVRTAERTLPIRYYHVVLTVPAALRPLFLADPRALYPLLFRAASAAIRSVAAEALEATIGYTQVLHTWNRRGLFHPHLHAIVSAGGLAPDGRWRSVPRAKSLLPLDRLRARFQHELLAGLDELRTLGELSLPADHRDLGDDDDAWAAFVDLLRRPLWEVYAKQTLERAEQAFRYLARYTTRVGVTNARVAAFDPRTNQVLFETKKGERFLIAGAELIRRLLLHVLPRGLHRVRHYGLLAPRNQALLAQARAALGCDPPPAPEARKKPESARELVLRLTGVDLARCPNCAALLHVLPLSPQLIERLQRATAPT